MNASTGSLDVEPVTGPIGFARNVIALGIGAMLVGCAAAPTPTTPAWRIEPLYRLTHSGPSAAPGYLALAERYESEGRQTLALEAFRKAAAAAPDDGRILHTLGLAYARRGQLDEAIEAFKAAVQQSPGQAQMLNNLGYALHLKGETAQARSAFQASLLSDPNYKQAHLNLAQLGNMATSSPVAKSAVPLDNSASPAQPLPDASIRLQTAPNVQPLAVVTQVSQELAHSTRQADTTPAPALETTGPLAVPTEATPTTAAAPLSDNLSGARIEIYNGNGVNGAAAGLRKWLRERDIQSLRLVNLAPYRTEVTRILYRPGHLAQAQEMARVLPVQTELVEVDAAQLHADLRVEIGHDMRNSTACAAIAACGTGSSGKTALADATPKSAPSMMARTGR